MEDSLLSISIMGTTYSLSQRKEETVENFKLRLQKYFDNNGINIEVV